MSRSLAIITCNRSVWHFRLIPDVVLTQCSTGEETPPIPYGAETSWECLPLQLLREVYVVDELHSTDWQHQYVTPVEELPSRPTYAEINDGADMTIPDSDSEHVYMVPSPDITIEEETM